MNGIIGGKPIWGCNPGRGPANPGIGGIVTAVDIGGGIPAKPGGGNRVIGPGIPGDADRDGGVS